MAVHSGYAATIPSVEFRFTGTDGLHVACARRDGRGPVRGVVHQPRPSPCAPTWLAGAPHKRGKIVLDFAGEGRV